MDILLSCVFLICLIAIFYHILGYPLALRLITKKQPAEKPSRQPFKHHFIFVLPMYNEARYIKHKIINLAHLDYPKQNYSILLLDDGSIDNTVAIAKKEIKKHPELNIEIFTFPFNRGKVAVFNEVIPTLPKDNILFFSDISAMLSINILKRANAYFNTSKIGAYCSRYINKNALVGEKKYWAYQNTIKINESKLGTPMGYHGSGYALRAALWQPVPTGTINDDFIMPLQIIEQGYQGIYDMKATSTEMEDSSEHIDKHRRQRIAEGNIQQVFILKNLLKPRYKWIAWMFFSCKVLRIFLPWCLIALFLITIALSFIHPTIYIPVLLCQSLFYLYGLFQSVIKTKSSATVLYFIKGNAWLLLGWLHFFNHKNPGRWGRAQHIKTVHYTHPIVRITKWCIDKTCAILGLTLFCICFPLFALIIKIQSPGPVLYRQLRVGTTTQYQTKFFFIYKFRTMHKTTINRSPRWTQKQDKRIFSFGHFLRKSHLDELPQFYNILKGNMSLIGPRPERLVLYAFISQKIPLYEERLHHVLPGLTGLAQIQRPPERTIYDLRKKLMIDLVYGCYISKPTLWFKTEIKIILYTILAVLRIKTPE